MRKLDQVFGLISKYAGLRRVGFGVSCSSPEKIKETGPDGPAKVQGPYRASGGMSFAVTASDFESPHSVNLISSPFKPSRWAFKIQNSQTGGLLLGSGGFVI